MSDGYQGLPKAEKWGCFVAAIIGFPLFFFLIMLDALGDCGPDASCHKGFLRMVLLPTVFVTGAVYVGVRFIIRPRNSDDS